MSAQTEADVKQLKQDVVDLQQRLFLLSSQSYAAVESLMERIQMLEAADNAIVEGDEVVVKAAPNGQAKAKKAHR